MPEVLNISILNNRIIVAGTISCLLLLLLFAYHRSSKQTDMKMSPWLIFYIAIPLVLILSIVSYKVGESVPIISGMHTELLGFLFDILLFGIVLSLYDSWKQKRLDIQRHKEIINDFRDWKEAEATFRITGSVRRLNSINASEKIDLSSSYLRETKFEKMNLSKARFDFSDLKKTSFRDSILNEASFYKTDLRNTRFSKVDLRKAKFTYANLQDAIIWLSNLQGADLWKANIKNAVFFFADLRDMPDLTAKHLCEARSLAGVKIDDELKKEVLKLCPEKLDEGNYEELDDGNIRIKDDRWDKAKAHYMFFKWIPEIRSDLSGTNLTDVDMREIDFTEADLSHANLKGANVRAADFTKANLKNVINIDAKQLCRAKSLYETILDTKLYEESYKLCPEKFSKPNYSRKDNKSKTTNSGSPYVIVSNIK
jgi:uncharacterized protein YjbI with pentapeptide repeats